MMNADNTQEARILRHLLSGRNIDKGDSMALGIGELHMRIKHIAETYCGFNYPCENLSGDRWRYWPIENIGVTKDGPRSVWHPDKGRAVSYAIYRLPDEYHNAMSEVGIKRGWLLPSAAPQITEEANHQLVLA